MNQKDLDSWYKRIMNKPIINPTKKETELLRKSYIEQFRTSNDPEKLLCAVRYILQTPTGASITDQAEKIMRAYAKNKTKKE